MCDMFIPTMLISTIWGGLLPCHYYVAIIVTVIIIISTITIGRQLFRDATLDVDSVELEFFFFFLYEIKLYPFPHPSLLYQHLQFRGKGGEFLAVYSVESLSQVMNQLIHIYKQQE